MVSILFLITSIVMFINAPLYMDKQFMTYNIILVGIMTIKLYNGGKSKTFDVSHIKVRHSIIFAVCFLIVFFQAALDYVIGFADDYSYFIYNSKVVCKGLALSNIAFASTLLGYDYGKKKEIIKNIKGAIEGDYFIINKYPLLLLAVTLLIIYLIFIPKDFLNNGYGADLSAGPVAMIIGYMTAIFIAIFVLYSRESQNVSENTWFNKNKTPLIICLCYIFIIIITGRRTEALRVAFIMLFSYIYCLNRRTNYKKIFLAGIWAVLIFSIVGVVRSMESGNIIEGYKNLSAIKSIMPFTQELSTSVNTLHIALSHFPNDYEYNSGLSFFPGFLKIIPGMSSFAALIFGNEILRGSDVIFTEIFFGASQRNYGVGSSMVADVYISFGPIGVVFVFMILGYFLRYLEIGTFCKSGSLYFMALSMSVYSQLMFACRSTIAIFFLCWTYSCLLIYMSKKVFRK